MATWKSRGLRGSILEDMINASNTEFTKRGLALVQKIPTPIKPVEFDSKNQRITLAYFEKKSTVDYIGVVQGVPICFDAKECAKDSFSLANIHKHQYEFMQAFELQEGLSFIILYFRTRDEMYYLRSSVLKNYIKTGQSSIKYESLDKSYLIRHKGLFIDYLSTIQLDLEDRRRKGILDE